MLERYGLAALMFEEVNAHLAESGQLLRARTIVDATILFAPHSTKNAKKERDPEMKQAKKGGQWHFGIATAKPDTGAWPKTQPNSNSSSPWPSARCR